MPNHHLRHLLFARGGDVDRCNVAAAADDRAPVRDLLDLLELVGNQDDRFALVDEVFHDRDELPDLHRCEHRGGFVENQHLGVAVEHLENLHPLLHTDRNLLDLRVGVHLQAVLPGELRDPRGGGFEVHRNAPARLQAEDDVLGHGEVVDQLEVLVHHADAQLVGDVGVGDLDLFALHQDLPLIRPVQPE